MLQRRQGELQSLWDKAKQRSTAAVHHGLHREERLSEERHSQEGQCKSKHWRRWSWVKCWAVSPSWFWPAGRMYPFVYLQHLDGIETAPTRSASMTARYPPIQPSLGKGWGKASSGRQGASCRMCTGRPGCQRSRRHSRTRWCRPLLIPQFRKGSWGRSAAQAG